MQVRYGFMNKIKAVAMSGAMLLIATTTANAHDVALEESSDKLSYVIGVEFAVQMSQQLQGLGIPLNGDAIAMAIADVLAGNNLKLSNEEMEAELQAFAERQAKLQEELTEMVISSGEEFRADFAAQDGVQSTDSGLLYRVVRGGDGAKPGPQSTVTVHYRGTLTDGTEFDSSYSRNEPTTFSLEGIIPGWTEVLQLTNVGSKIEVLIPPDLAYGPQGSPPVIPPSATLFFEIELLAIE